SRREDYHRHVRSTSTNRSQHLIAIDTRQHQIENDELRIPALRRRDGVGPRLGDLNVVPLELEVVLDSLGEGRIVLDDENPGAHCAIASGGEEAGIGTRETG